jgi:hypothetical protein
MQNNDHSDQQRKQNSLTGETTSRTVATQNNDHSDQSRKQTA